MPFATVKLVGGVNAEKTPVLNEASISSSQLIRFREGLVQKLGGWDLFYPSAIPGIPRDLHAWEDLEAVTHLGIGAVNYLGVITNGVLNNITPQYNVINISNAFSTVAGQTKVLVYAPGSQVGEDDVIVFNTPVSVGGVILFGVYAVAEYFGPDYFYINAAAAATSTITNGGAVPVFYTNANSATVTVIFANHVYTVGQTITYPILTSVGGINISGFYVVYSVTDANTFSFVAATIATSTASAAMNGGNAQITDWIAPTLVDLNSGYGIGTYGEGGYGSGFPLPIHTGTEIQASNWSLDNFGEILVACSNGGPIFTWGPTTGNLYGQVIPQAPIANGGIFLAMPEEMIVAWGASTFNVSDPMLVAWCDAGNYNVWTAATGNQAGTYRIPRGSKIVGGLQSPQQALIWTDLSIWSMTYVGYPLVWGFNEIASGCGLIGQHAAEVIETSVYWMSQKAFFVLSGGSVSPIECTVWDVIFQNLNTAYAGNIRAAANSQFNEMAWYYPSNSSVSGENDSYVKLNTLTNEWDYGLLARTAWIDQSVLGSPIGTDTSGYIYQHETSNDANGTALNSSFQTGFFMLSDGEDIPFIDRVMPDFKWGFYNAPQTATIQMTLYGYNDAGAIDDPSQVPSVYGPYTVTRSTNFFNPRARNRFLAINVASDDLGSFWRLGGCKFRYAPDGRQ